MKNRTLTSLAAEDSVDDKSFIKTIVEPLLKIERKPISKNIIESMIETKDFSDLIEIGDYAFEADAANLLIDYVVDNPSSLPMMASYESSQERYTSVLVSMFKYLDDEHALKIIKTIINTKFQDEALVYKMLITDEQKNHLISNPEILNNMPVKYLFKLYDISKIKRSQMNEVLSSIKDKKALMASAVSLELKFSNAYIFSETSNSARLVVNLYNDIMESGTGEDVEELIQSYIMKFIKIINIISPKEKDYSDQRSIAEVGNIFSMITLTKRQQTKILLSQLIEKIKEIVKDENIKSDYLMTNACDEIQSQNTYESELIKLSKNKTLVECFLKRESFSDELALSLADGVFSTNNLLIIKSFMNKLKKDPSKNNVIKQIEKKFGKMPQWLEVIRKKNEVLSIQEEEVDKEETPGENSGSLVQQDTTSVPGYIVNVIKLDNADKYIYEIYKDNKLIDKVLADSAYEFMEVALADGITMAKQYKDADEQKDSIEQEETGELFDYDNDNVSGFVVKVIRYLTKEDKYKFTWEVWKDDQLLNKTKMSEAYDSPEQVMADGIAMAQQYKSQHYGVENQDQVIEVGFKNMKTCKIVILKWHNEEKFAWRKMTFDKTEDLGGGGFVYSSAEEALKAAEKVMGDK